ncbi:MAG TPA: hypothetical protein P5059_00030 [Candidatus Dojkabacteria bacterium]|nr:hypothetical protein [Candidatus Dojkabacteria bacterium]
MATQYVNTQSQALLISYFKDRDALSENKAIKIMPLDWRVMGVQLVNPEKSIRTWYPFIKEINGKYWLDAESLELYYKRWRTIIITTLIITTALLVALAIE